VALRFSPYHNSTGTPLPCALARGCMQLAVASVNRGGKGASKRENRARTRGALRTCRHSLALEKACASGCLQRGNKQPAR
jgi:hypothetical protein